MGLTEAVYHGVPNYGFYPTDTIINDEQAYIAASTPAYTFLNTQTGFQYSAGSPATIANFLGTDAAGAATTDNYGLSSFAINASGYINISTSGNYTFTISQGDDAARLTIGGSVVAENDFNESGLSVPSSATRYLTAGSYTFDLFLYQTVGRTDLSYSVSNAAGPVSYSTDAIPEPAATWLLGWGVLALLTLRRRGAISPGLPVRSLAGARLPHPSRIAA
jgi:hypothetical protein